MKNITLSADAALIEAARARAQEQHSTLNEQFRLWLADYAHPQERLQRYDTVSKTRSSRRRAHGRLLEAAESAVVSR